MAIKYIQAYMLGTVPEMLMAMRKEAKLTQKELAKSIGINESTYSRYEKGTRRVPFEIFQRVTEATGHQIQII